VLACAFSPTTNLWKPYSSLIVSRMNRVRGGDRYFERRLNSNESANMIRNFDQMYSPLFLRQNHRVDAGRSRKSALDVSPSGENLFQQFVFNLQALTSNREAAHTRTETLLPVFKTALALQSRYGWDVNDEHFRIIWN
jgi:hypothetical protein